MASSKHLDQALQNQIALNRLAVKEVILCLYELVKTVEFMGFKSTIFYMNY